ncbi:hypothetical protein HAX54_044609 [Datura stramonium]|uniref:Uncharacterized protein n=1 Tax=Datura stramonium TaxID=4076 RepID=A0ABS8WIT6_DATST|nr:hypothetical protein [Datura stramonium]
MEFYSNFEPLESYSDQKIDKLKEGLAGVTTIRRDLAGVEKDDAVSKAINEVVASYVAGDATRTDDDHHSCGGGYTPLDTGGAGDAGGVGDAGGRYTPAAEKVRRQEDTPYRLGRSSVVGTSKVSSCACVRPYPGGVPWLGAKRIFTVMTLEKKYFVALEFMINDGVINVYGCNIPCCPEDEFFQHI